QGIDQGDQGNSIYQGFRKVFFGFFNFFSDKPQSNPPFKGPESVPGGNYQSADERNAGKSVYGIIGPMRFKSLCTARTTSKSSGNNVGDADDNKKGENLADQSAFAGTSDIGNGKSDYAQARYNFCSDIIQKMDSQESHIFPLGR